jgi:hypothetical protein
MISAHKLLLSHLINAPSLVKALSSFDINGSGHSRRGRMLVFEIQRKNGNEDMIKQRDN